MRTITGPSREKVILYAGVLIFILFIRNLLFAEDPFDEEASLKLWKSLDPGMSKNAEKGATHVFLRASRASM